MDQAKQEIYKRAGQLAGGAHIDIEGTDFMDYSLAKAVIVTTIPEYFRPWSAEQKQLVKELEKI